MFGITTLTPVAGVVKFLYELYPRAVILLVIEFIVIVFGIVKLDPTDTLFIKYDIPYPSS